MSIAISDPHQPHYSQPWNVPQLLLTGGPIYFDTESWVREKIVDEFLVYGYCYPPLQVRAVRDLRWMCRDTGTSVSILTSSVYAPHFKPFATEAVPLVCGLHAEEDYLLRWNLSEPPSDALASGPELQTMHALALVSAERRTAKVDEIAPLLRHEDPIMRRLAVTALAQLEDEAAIPLIERALSDSENAVRGKAALALKEVHRPESLKPLLEAVSRYPNHSLEEAAVIALMAMASEVSSGLVAALGSESASVRVVASRALRAARTSDKARDALIGALDDNEPYVRFSAAYTLSIYRRHPKVVQALLAKVQRSQDPALVARAATSLAVILAKPHQTVTEIRQLAVQTILSQYTELTRGRLSQHANWLYRPLGNALLDIGGEDAHESLDQLRLQDKDERLAFLAWKTLFVPQRGGTFSQVTEQQNEMAFEHLPQRLKKHSSSRRH